MKYLLLLVAVLLSLLTINAVELDETHHHHHRKHHGKPVHHEKVQQRQHKKKKLHHQSVAATKVHQKHKMTLEEKEKEQLKVNITLNKKHMELIREKMKEKGLDAYLVFHGDAHMSEYTAAKDERIAFITGFTGSSGVALITKDKAFTWTDGRYYIQAQKQLYPGWKLMKSEQKMPTYGEWLKDNLGKGAKVGVDEIQVTAKGFAKKKELFEKNNQTYTPLASSILDEVWGKSRPKMPADKVFILDQKWTGQSVGEKYNALAGKMGKDADMMVISTLDDIAWLLNLRGNDIEFNPLFFSYVVFHQNNQTNHHVDLFINKEKVAEPKLKKYLSENNVTVHGYDDVAKVMKSIANKTDNKKIIIDDASLNQYFFNVLKANNYTTVNKEKMMQHLKAVKNAVQQEGMRQCNIRDSAAIMKQFAWLEAELKKPNHGLDEYAGARKVEEFRAEGQFYQGPSFATISSTGPNGAIIHYTPEEKTSLKLSNDDIYLLDSGGQYLDGTTDITRTCHFGGAKKPTKFQKEAYTRVLEGVLSLEKVVWPADSQIGGCDLDILARQSLFEAGLDYTHGTGHGVGSFLNVHEGPESITKRDRMKPEDGPGACGVKLEEGMCVSDEPGYYQEGEFGIRIENVIMVVKHPKLDNRLMFENLTLAPYCRSLIDTNLLEQGMIDYINTFHKKVLKNLRPYLANSPQALDYVERQCAPLYK